MLLGPTGAAHRARRSVRPSTAKHLGDVAALAWSATRTARRRATLVEVRRSATSAACSGVPSPDRPRRWSRSSRPRRWAAGHARRPSRGRAGRSRGRAGRTRPVGREPVAADVRDLPGLRRVGRRPGPPRPDGRARRSRCRAGRACRPRSTGSGCGVRPERAAGAERLDVEVVDLVQVVEDGGLEPGLGVVGVRREDAQPLGRRRPPAGPADQQHPDPWPRPRARQLVAEPVGQPGVAQRVLAPRARGARPAGRRAPSRRCRPSARPACGSRRRSGSSRSLRPATSSSPSRTSRRAQHQPALLVQRQVAGLQLGAGADLVERRPEPGRHVRDRSPSRTSTARPGPSSTHGWPGRRRSRVSSAIAPDGDAVDQPARAAAAAAR